MVAGADTGIVKSSNAVSVVQLRRSATFVDIVVNNKKLSVLLDSGAEDTLISTKQARLFGLRVNPLESNEVRYVGANGLDCVIDGWTVVEARVGQYMFHQRCVVIRDLSNPVLLGCDALINHGFVLNFETKTVSVGRVVLRMRLVKEQSATSLTASSRIELKPQQWHCAMVNVPTSFTDCLVESVALRDVRCLEGLVEARDGRLPLFLFNQKRFPVVIEKGKFLGNVESVNVKAVSSVKQSAPLKRLPVKARKSVKIYDKLKPNERKALDALLDEFDHVFSKSSTDLGHYTKEKFVIDTGDHQPIKVRPHRAPYMQKAEIETMVDEMLAGKIISRSTSGWSSPVVIVKKKDGTSRRLIWLVDIGRWHWTSCLRRKLRSSRRLGNTSSRDFRLV